MTIARCLGVFLLFGAAPGALHADAPDSVVGTVDTVIVTGNDKTRSYVILDEMALRPGTPITPAAIEYDRNRIYSLGLFNNVDILLDTTTSRTILFVDVHERWYILPVPLIGFRDGDVKKLYAGGGLLHSNFDGRNQKLFGSVVFGMPSAHRESPQDRCRHHRRKRSQREPWRSSALASKPSTRSDTRCLEV